MTVTQITTGKIIPINENYQIEVMPSGNHYPMCKHVDGRFYYFRQGHNGQKKFKTERGARKFLAEYIDSK